MLAFAFLLIVIGVFTILLQRPWEVIGSVAVGNQYQSTTTPLVVNKTNLCPARSDMPSQTTGVLGSVNVLKSGAGTLTFYDATTTNASKRSSDQATSSILMVDFPASPTVESYHFDIEFKRGLLVDYTTTGTGVSSTTISYRCEG